MGLTKTVVIIPTYNERENLRPLVEAILSGQNQVDGFDWKAIGWRDYTLVPALVYEALQKSARLKEFPIIFVDRRTGKSKIPAVRYALNLLRHFIATSLRYRLGRPRGNL